MFEVFHFSGEFALFTSILPFQLPSITGIQDNRGKAYMIFTENGKQLDVLYVV